MTITVTYPLAMAAGQDAGNRSMKSAGRAKWNYDDYEVAALVVNELLFGKSGPTP